MGPVDKGSVDVKTLTSLRLLVMPVYILEMLIGVARNNIYAKSKYDTYFLNILYHLLLQFSSFTSFIMQSSFSHGNSYAPPAEANIYEFQASKYHC